MRPQRAGGVNRSQHAVQRAVDQTRAELDRLELRMTVGQNAADDNVAALRRELRVLRADLTTLQTEVITEIDGGEG